MPKTIKFYELLETQKNKKTHSSQLISINAITKKNAPITFLSILLTMGIIAVTILSYYSESIYFTNIIVGLSIFGLISIIKTIGNQKTIIKKIKH